MFRERFGEQYCIFCGEDYETVHLPECPSNGYTTKGGYISYGIKEGKDELENLRVASLGKIMVFSQEGLISTFPTINTHRIIFEFIYEQTENILSLISKASQLRDRGVPILDSVRSKMYFRRARKGFNSLKKWYLTWVELERSTYLEESDNLLDNVASVFPDEFPVQTFSPDEFTEEKHFGELQSARIEELRNNIAAIGLGTSFVEQNYR